MQIDSARRNNFDALRVAAALSVLVSHQHALSGLPEPSAFRRRRMRLALGVSWLLGLAALAARQPLLALWLTAPITVLAIGLASTPYLREAGRFGDLSYGAVHLRLSGAADPDLGLQGPASMDGHPGLDALHRLLAGVCVVASCRKTCPASQARQASDSTFARPANGPSLTFKSN